MPTTSIDRQRRETEQRESWTEWTQKMPYLDFPAEWQVRPIPPFGGALVRFTVRRSDTPDTERVSVYFDGFERLGLGGENGYWEVYPSPRNESDTDGDAVRCRPQATDELLELIANGLDLLAENQESTDD